MKNQRGVIALVTLGTVIFMLAFLLSSFVIIQNRLQSQAEIKKETANLYAKDLDNIENIYQSYFAKDTDVVPITNEEQLLNIGTGKEFMIDGKFYKYTPEKNYILKGNLEINIEKYINEYSDKVKTHTVNNTSVYTWIGINELKSRNFLTGKFNGQNYTIEIITGENVITYDKSNNFSI